MRISLFAVMLALVAGTSASAQQYVGWRPYYGPVAPAAYAQMPMEAPLPDAGADEGPAPSAGADAVGTGCAAGGCSDCGDCGGACDDCGCGRLGIGDRLFCGPPRGWYANFEYNMWWTKRRDLPPLVTTSPAGTPLLQTGVLPGATLLAGGNELADDLGHGGRVTFGKWFDPYETVGLGARFTAFEGDAAGIDVTSDGTTNLAIPFFDALLGQENAYLVAFTPNGSAVFAEGNVNVQDSLDIIDAQVFGQFNIYNECGTRFDFLGGYHMLRLDNSLSIESTLISRNIAIVSPVGTEIFTRDHFEGRNEFHGGVVGMMAGLDFDKWFFNISGKMSVGNMNQRVVIDGVTVVTSPGGATDVRDEGLFALGTNQGISSRDKVVYIPEANVKVGYRVTPNVAATIGYNFTYISSVVLAGDAIDRNLNLSQTNGGLLVGPVAPQSFGLRDTDFWAQGINFGLDVKF